MKNLVIAVIAVMFVVGLSSCASQEQCWAYRSSGKFKYNNNKNRPSVAGAMNRHSAKLRY